MGSSSFVTPGPAHARLFAVWCSSLGSSNTSSSICPSFDNIWIVSLCPVQFLSFSITHVTNCLHQIPTVSNTESALLSFGWTFTHILPQKFIRVYAVKDRAPNIARSGSASVRNQIVLYLHLNQDIQYTGCKQLKCHLFRRVSQHPPPQITPHCFLLAIFSTWFHLIYLFACLLSVSLPTGI